MKAVYDITPVAKPRMVRVDKWRKRPVVEHYRAFKDECRFKKVTLPESGTWITFVLPMPDSWSEEKKQCMEGSAHRQTPDLDNCVKALADALYGQDCTIWDFRATKLWGRTGQIIIDTITGD